MIFSPYVVFTDQGRISKMCQSLWIHKKQITPCRPSVSGQVERYNRTLIEAVLYYIDGCPKRWDQYLDPFAGDLIGTLGTQQTN